MTREELIDKISEHIRVHVTGSEYDESYGMDKHEANLASQKIISIIFESIRYVTPEMEDAAWESDGTDWIGEHKVLNGLTYVWQAMLNKSSLAPKD